MSQTWNVQKIDRLASRATAMQITILFVAVVVAALVVSSAFRNRRNSHAGNDTPPVQGSASQGAYEYTCHALESLRSDVGADEDIDRALEFIDRMRCKQSHFDTSADRPTSITAKHN